jgi:hypothetical protein
MSGLGQKQTSDSRLLMSAIHPKADIAERATGMSALCQKRTFCAAANNVDHLVDGGEEIG